MARTWLVARREFVENARTKGFWISILLGPLLILGSIGLMIFFKDKKDVRDFAVWDKGGWLAQAIEDRAVAPDLRALLKARAKGELDGKADEEAGTPSYPEPRFLDSEVWKGMAGLEGEHAGKLSTFGRFLVGEDFAKADALFSSGQLPGLAKILLDKAGVDDDQLQRTWAEFGAFRGWWEGLPDSIKKPYLGAASDPRFRLVDPPEGGWDQEALEELLKSGELFAYFVLEDVPLEQSRIGRYISDNVTDQALRRWFERRATEVLRERRIAKLGLDDRKAQLILARAQFVEKTIDAETGEEKAVDVALKASKAAPVVFVILLWMSVLMISQMLLTNTIEEKSNRIIEVLLSSVSPLQLMTGKIVGLALTGFSVLAFYALFAAGVVTLTPYILPDVAKFMLEIGIESILSNPVYLGSFFLYFLTGYVFYASILVGIGSVSNSLKDAQNLALPVMILLSVPYIASFMLIQDPNGMIARVLSYIPPFTPFIMMARAGGPPPMIDYVLTTILLLISILLCFYGSAKIFRAGILMAGKPPRIGDLFRMLKAPIGSVSQR